MTRTGGGIRQDKERAIDTLKAQCLMSNHWHRAKCLNSGRILEDSAPDAMLEAIALLKVSGRLDRKQIDAVRKLVHAVQQLERLIDAGGCASQVGRDTA
jgi:hypothetical protein